MNAGIIGRHVAISAWIKNEYVENVGEVVACSHRNDDDSFVLLVARDDGSLTSVTDSVVRIIDAAEFKRLIRNERRRSRKS